MAFVDRLGGLLGPAGLSPEDQRRLGQLSLLNAGLAILSGRGPQAIGQGLLSGAQFGANAGQQMLADARQRDAEERARQLREQLSGAGSPLPEQIRPLASLDPEAAMKVGQYLAQQKLAESQLDKLKNPTTPDIVEFQFAKQNGFTGTFEDWQKLRLSASGSVPAQIQMYNLARSQGYKGTLEDWLREQASLHTYGIAGLTPEQNEALFGPNGAVTTGKLDPRMINSRTARLYADAYVRNPDVNMNRLAADANLQRNPTFQQRTMAIEALPEIMQTMTELGKKVGYSDIRAVGKMQAWVNGQLNDPDWQEYMTVRNDALMTIASVMRGVGMSDKAHEAEIEAANPTMSPRALDAWLRAQMHALEPRLRRIERVKNLGEEVPKPAQSESSKVIDWSQLQ